MPLRNAVADLIASEDGLEVVGSTASAEEAIELAAALEPDVAIVDVRMPGGGTRAACGIRERSPATRVVALSAYDDRPTILEMIRCGAVGYLVKGISRKSSSRRSGGQRGAKPVSRSIRSRASRTS